jgi:parvulin-like peptidyl-prolyl isomerase
VEQEKQRIAGIIPHKRRSVKVFNNNLYKIVALSMVIALIPVPGISRAEVVDKVIVQVNDEIITQREFDRAFQPIQENYKANFQGEDLEKKLKEVHDAFLDQLINTKVAISEAKKQKIEVKDAELDERLNKIKSLYGSEDVFLQALNDKGTNLTEFKKEIKDQMMAQKLVEEQVAKKIVITPGEINELYEKNKEQLVTPKRVKVKEIMVRKAENVPAEESKKKISDIQAELKKGTAFSEVAKQYSEGPYAAAGGDMGFVVKGQLLEEMDGAIFSASKGQTTDIVETRIGYHIFMIEDIEEPRKLGLNEVNDFLKGQLYRKKFEDNLVKWLDEKRKNAYISVK